MFSDRQAWTIINEQLTMINYQLSTHESPTSDNSTQPQMIGDYEVVKELGHGGTGVVYLALQPGLKRKVAIELMLPIERDHQLDEQKQAEKEKRARNWTLLIFHLYSLLKKSQIRSVAFTRSTSGPPSLSPKPPLPPGQ